MTIVCTPVHISGVKLNDIRTAASDEYRTSSRRVIHPHQKYRPTSRHNCLRTDIWIRVRKWVLRNLNRNINAELRNRTISERTSNSLYDRYI